MNNKLFVVFILVAATGGVLLAQQNMRGAGDGGVYIGVGPNMQSLDPGVYRFIFVPQDGSKEPVTRTFVIGSKPAPKPGPPPTPPVPPDTVSAKVSQALGKVTASNKKQTASAFSSAFGQLVKSAGDGSITSKDQLVMAANLFLVTIPLQDAAAWQPFAEVVKEVVSAGGDLAACVESMKLVIVELGKVP